MTSQLDRVLGPVRSRLVETLSGRSDRIPSWVLRLEDGEDEGFFAAGSAPWVVHGGMPTLVAGVRALLLQALHPGALAGVRENSRYREDPLGRLAGTIQWIHTVTFGSRGQAIAGSEMVKSLHRSVVGTYVDGRGGHSMRLNFSGVDDEEIREGVRRIGKVISEQVELYGALTGERRLPARPAEGEAEASEAGEENVVPFRKSGEAGA